MKKRTKIIAALAAVAISGVAAHAVASGFDGKRFGGMSGPHGGGMTMMLERYDTNGDGKVDVAEAKAAREAQFKKFDANKDGTLDLKEYQALWMDAMRERMVDRFQSHDDDGNGAMTLAEFNGRFERMISMMDRNGDGTISPDDRGGFGKHGGMRGEGGDHGGQCNDGGKGMGPNRG